MRTPRKKSRHSTLLKYQRPGHLSWENETPHAKPRYASRKITKSKWEAAKSRLETTLFQLVRPLSPRTWFYPARIEWRVRSLSRRLPPPARPRSPSPRLYRLELSTPATALVPHRSARDLEFVYLTHVAYFLDGALGYETVHRHLHRRGALSVSNSCPRPETDIFLVDELLFSTVSGFSSDNASNETLDQRLSFQAESDLLGGGWGGGTMRVCGGGMLENDSRQERP